MIDQPTVEEMARTLWDRIQRAHRKVHVVYAGGMFKLHLAGTVEGERAVNRAGSTHLGTYTGQVQYLDLLSDVRLMVRGVR